MQFLLPLEGLKVQDDLEEDKGRLQTESECEAEEDSAVEHDGLGSLERFEEHCRARDAANRMQQKQLMAEWMLDYAL